MIYLVTLAAVAIVAIGASRLAYGAAQRLNQAPSHLVLFALLLPCVAMWRLASDDGWAIVTLVGMASWLLIVILGWLAGRVDSGRGFARLAKTVLAVAVGLATTGAYLEWYDETAPRRAREIERMRSMAGAERGARHCVSAIARRDPQADAMADVARGDATPIGIAYYGHGPTLVTNYPAACPHPLEAQGYQATGKWFRYTEDSFDFGEPAPSHGRCLVAARDYVEQYNRHMRSIRPAAVARFCRSLLDRPRRSDLHIGALGATSFRRQRNSRFQASSGVASLQLLSALL